MQATTTTDATAGLERIPPHLVPAHLRDRQLVGGANSVLDDERDVVLFHDRLDGRRWLFRDNVEAGLEVAGHGTAGIAIRRADGSLVCTVQASRVGVWTARYPTGRTMATADTWAGLLARVARRYLRPAKADR